MITLNYPKIRYNETENTFFISLFRPIYFHTLQFPIFLILSIILYQFYPFHRVISTRTLFKSLCFLFVFYVSELLKNFIKFLRSIINLIIAMANFAILILLTELLLQEFSCVMILSPFLFFIIAFKHIQFLFIFFL